MLYCRSRAASFRSRPGKELRRDGESIVNKLLRHAVIGNDEKPGVRKGACEGPSKCGCGARFADEIRPDVEHRNAALIRSENGT